MLSCATGSRFLHGFPSIHMFPTRLLTRLYKIERLAPCTLHADGSLAERLLKEYYTFQSRFSFHALAVSKLNPIASSSNRRFEFHKRSQLFIRTHNEILSSTRCVGHFRDHPESPASVRNSISMEASNLKFSFYFPFKRRRQ
jgi:hypothetical protein